MDPALLAAWLGQQEELIAPGYHYDMMHDTERNAAYAAALLLTVQPDDLVLDIGAGSGLLSLLASKTPAQHIFACEADAVLADAARAVVEANGLSDKITIHSKMSTDLVIGWSNDLPSKAHVLVTEIFDSPLIGEGVLPTLCGARFVFESRVLCLGMLVCLDRFNTCCCWRGAANTWV
jgi:protein arginine N-methyltransferase 7